MAKRTFVGFSTRAEKSGRRSWVLFDTDLIKRDLFNHFYTRYGERVMRPTFGCRIWDYVMEPNVDMIRAEIVSEVERVIRLDERLDVRDITLYERDHTIIISCTLVYRPFRTTELFQLEFDRRQGVA